MAFCFLVFFITGFVSFWEFAAFHWEKKLAIYFDQFWQKSGNNFINILWFLVEFEALKYLDTGKHHVLSFFYSYWSSVDGAVTVSCRENNR